MALDTDLISYWKLDESSGNAADSVGSNTATNVNVTYTTGKIKNGAVFNGTDGFLSITSPSTALKSLGYTSDFTITMWVKPNSLSNKCTLFNSRGKDTNSPIDFILETDLKLKFDRYTPIGGSVTGSLTLTNNSWNFVAVQLDDSNNKVKFWVNGSSEELSYTETYSGGSPTACVIGGRNINGSLDQPFKGMIDEVGIWSRKLTSDEISELYNSGAGLQYPFLTAYTLVVDKMALALTYADVTLKKAIKLVVDTMALSFTFADVIFNNARTLIVDTMALSLTYADVTLKKAVKLVVDTMSLILDFKNVILKKIGWNNDTKPSDTWTNDSK